MDDKKKNRYFNNSPISSEEYYGEGVEAIDEMVANKDVFNIGVIAPYGAGKSSLIKTFKESNSLKAKRNKKKIAEISLLHLSEQDDNKKESSDKEPVKNKDALLEKSILEQLFFKEGRAKLPFSKIERIHNRVLTSFLVAFLVVVSTLSLLFAIMEYKKVLPWSDGNNLLVYIVVAAVSLLLTITSLILSFRIGKISFQNIEIEFNKIESGSVLNFFLDEIVYFFKNTKTDVVIFEDIERFGSVSLFTKLREINHVLNNNKRIKRKITFIYCVTDDFFAGERDRAKFFEFVISLVPILNPKNVNEHIVSCLKENNIELNDVFLKKISRFIADKRVLNDIINDFIYFGTTPDISVLDKEKLFAMMVYKNVCFKDYVNLLEEKGDLFDLFNSCKQQIIDNVSLELRNQFNTLQKSIENVKESTSVIKRFADLKDLISGIISREGDSSPTIPTDYVDVLSAKTFSNVSTGLYIALNVSILSNHYYNQQTRGTAYKYMDLEKLNSKLGRTIKEYEDLISGSTLRNLDEQKRHVASELSFINGLKLQQLLERYDVPDNLKLKVTKNQFLLFAVKNGYIDETYYMYIGQHDSKIDSSFINSVMSDAPTDPAAVLKNCELIIEELDKSEFGNKYIFNYSLIESLFGKSGNLEKKEVFLNYLSSRNDDTKKFVKDYYLSGRSFDEFFCSLCNHNKFALFDLLNDQDIAEKGKIDLIKLFIQRKALNEITGFNIDSIIAKTIENCSFPIEGLSSIFKKASQFVDFAKIVGIKEIVNIDYKGEDNLIQKDIFRAIIENRWFAINYNNIESIEIYYFEKNDVTLTTLLLENEELANYFNSSLSDVVSYIASNNNSLHEKANVVNSLLASQNISGDTKIAFLRSLADSVPFSKEFDLDVCLALLREDKMGKTWSNVAGAFHIGDNVNDEIISFIIRNIDYFEDKLIDVDLFKFVLSKISHNQHLAGLKGKLLDMVDLSIGAEYVDDDIMCKVLIEKEIVEPTKSNFITLSNKPYSIIAMLIKNPGLASDIPMLTLNADNLMAIVESNEINPAFTKEFIKSNSATVEENTTNYRLCKAILNFFITSNDVVLPAKLVSKIYNTSLLNKYSSTERAKGLCLKKYESKELVVFIGETNKAIIDMLKPVNGNDAYIKTPIYDSNEFIKALLEKKIIHKVQRSKNNTRVNVTILLGLLK